MFGLPVATTLLVFGFPLFWIIYTVIFYFASRNWGDDATVDEESS